jgi:hypothetical protein
LDTQIVSSGIIPAGNEYAGFISYRFTVESGSNLSTIIFSIVGIVLILGCAILFLKNKKPKKINKRAI